MSETVIQFNPDGTALCVWTEAVPLAELGTLEMCRASNVEFDAGLQLWQVRLSSAPDRVAFSHPSRAVCIEWEVRHLNETLCSQPQ